MTFDFYCALCGGPLRSGLVNYGSSSPKALEKRRKGIAEHRREQQTRKSTIDEDAAGEDRKEPENADGVEDERRLDVPDRTAKAAESVCTNDADSQSKMEIHGEVFISSSEGESDWSADSDEERQSYDPERLHEGDVAWLDHCRALSFNARAPGITKAFISGRGHYDGSSFVVEKVGRDPNDSGEWNLTCFRAYNKEETASFPFHEACYKILARKLGHYRYQAVDKDVLYGTVAGLADDRALKLSYAISGQEQYWECIPGEEYSVCDPSFQPTLEAVLPGMLPLRLFEKAETNNRFRKARHDPFHALSYVVLLQILERLGTRDMLSLTRASAATISSVQFWKDMMHLRILPWFWELAAMLKKCPLQESLDYKRLFLWSHSVTNPEYGSDCRLMGVANRRRIWDVCQPLMRAYTQRLDRTSSERQEEMQAKALLGTAKAFDVPNVCYPAPLGAKSSTVQFICSWNELTERACEVDTYWGDDGEGALVGIAITMGESRRIFGTTDATPGLPMHLAADEWIQEIRFSLTDCDMFEVDLNRNHRQAVDIGAGKAGQCFVGGMEIILTSGRSKVVKSGGLNSRAFIVFPHMHLIGVTGTIAPNGVISSFGVLQARQPELDSSTLAPCYTQTQSILWAPSALQVYGEPNSHRRSPIWQSSVYNLHTFTSDADHGGGALPSAITPHDLFLWGDTPSKLKSLRRVSAFSLVVGFCNGPIRELLGFATFHHGSEHATQQVGTFGPVASQIPHWDSKGYGLNYIGGEHKPVVSIQHHLSSHYHPFDAQHMSDFDIDGPAGEEVSEVHVRTDFKAVRLETNWGRGCYWGEEGGESDWYRRKAGDEECIVGLSACFGGLGGWSVKARIHSHWRLSELGVVLARRDGRGW